MSSDKNFDSGILKNNHTENNHSENSILGTNNLISCKNLYPVSENYIPNDLKYCCEKVLPKENIIARCLPLNNKTDCRTVFSKLRISKNLFVVCLSFLLTFTAYEALMNLQSTINATRNIGTYTLAVVYASFCVSCLILPSFIIDKLGCKLTLVFSLFAYSPYIAANFYPTWSIFIPTAALCGMAAGPLWAARCSYVNELCNLYTIHINGTLSVITALFFGICCMFYQAAQILGNFISYQVLKPMDITHNENFRIRNICGANFCNNDINNNISISDLNPNLEPPTHDQRNILIGTFLICSLVSAFVVWLFLDGLKLTNDSKDSHTPVKTLTLLFAAFKQLKRRKQLLLVPLTFHLGLSDGFLFGDFTKAYIGCAWKIYHVGYVMMAYGTISSIFSVISVIIVKHFGRISLFIISGTINALTYIFLLLWNPNPDQPASFFLVAIAWGCSDAVWWGQLNALYGLLFKNDNNAAFSIFFFINSCGFLLAYAYESILCTYIKIYILLFVLIVGIIMYLIVEYT